MKVLIRNGLVVPDAEVRRDPLAVLLISVRGGSYTHTHTHTHTQTHTPLTSDHVVAPAVFGLNFRHTHTNTHTHKHTHTQHKHPSHLTTS